MSGVIRARRLQTQAALAGLLDQASAAQPGDIALAHRCATALLQLHDEEGAIAAARRPTAANPDDPTGWEALAVLCHARNRSAESVAAYERAIALAPNSVACLGGLGFALRALGDDQRADAIFARAHALDPTDARAVRGHGQTLARKGAAIELLAYCEAAMERVGPRPWLIGHYMVALARLERRAALEWLLDYDALLDISVHQAFAGFASLDAFHTALREELIALGTVPSGNMPNDVLHGALRVPGGPWGAISTFGTDGAPASAALVEMIERRLEHHADTLVDSLPRRTRPSSLTPKSAAIFSRKQSYVAPHNHPDTWATVVYYAAVPDSIRRGDSVAGCMEFCPPHHKYTFSDGVWPTRLIRPEPGMLVLIPGYACHQVHAYADADERIVVTADMYPSGDGIVTGISHEKWLKDMPQE